MAARSNASGGGLKSAGMLRIVGVVTLVVAALAIGAVRMGFIHLPGSHDDDSVLAKGNESAATTPARPAAPAKKPATAMDAVNLDAPAEEPTPNTQTDGAPPAKRPGTRMAATSGAGA